MTWTEALDEFATYLRLERSLSPNTVAAYVHDASLLARHREDRPPLAITPDDVSEFLRHLCALGLGARSQARILSGIRAFFRFLLIEDRIAADPSENLEAPTLPQHYPEVLTYAEIQRMLDGIDLSHPQGTRNRAILETLYACGLRVSELVNLRLSHYYPEIGLLKVLGKNDKERIVPIGEAAIKHIGLYLEGDRRRRTHIARGHEDILFLNRRGRRLTRVMIFNIVRAAARNAGIQKAVSPHTFRHSFATHLIEGGADLKAVQDLLGHESITTTELYLHLDTEFLRETLASCHPRFHTP